MITMTHNLIIRIRIINTYFNRQHKAQAHADPQNDKNYKNNGTPEPMEVDPSFSKLLQPTHANGYQNRRPATSERREETAKN